MSILWCGGEDIDFPNGSAITTNIGTTNFRTGYPRFSIVPTTVGSFAYSNSFSGLTNFWFSTQVGNSGTGSPPNVFLGLTTAPNNLAGLWLYLSTATKLALAKYDGTTVTVLATESGTSLGGMVKLDVHCTNFGSSATVTVYVNGSSVISYSGSTLVTGVTSVSCCAIRNVNNLTFSELIVADEDTRAMSLVTLAPSAAGTTDQWTGVYTDVNENTNNDATVAYTNTVDQDEQFNVNDLPSGTYSVSAVRIAARAAKSASASVGNLQLGLNSGGTVGVGSSQALAAAWNTLDTILSVNPVTGVAFTLAEINALQLNIRSKA